MQVRYWDREKDYDMLVEWWNSWRFTPPANNCLPPTGIIVSSDGIDVVSGFLYVSNSSLCWIEFIVSNPNMKDRELRLDCIDKCINTLCDIAKEMGYGMAYASLNKESLQERYVLCGFLEGSRDCKEYIKILK